MRVSVRSWLIRGLILTGVAAIVALGWIANSWVSPERVREQVIAALNEQFDGVDVEVGSARMRILGGIAVHDVKLTRHGGPTNRPFLVVPSAILYHDKEQLSRGRLVIRKVELESPEFRLERTADGRWNLLDVMRSGPSDRPVPMFVTRGATLTVTDQMPGGLPPLHLAKALLDVRNDPLPVLTIHAEAVADGFGPVEVMARLNRVTRHASIRLSLPALPLGEIAPTVAAALCPNLTPYLGGLTATASIKADLTYTPDVTPAWRHDVQVEVKDGQLTHPDLPWPIKKIAVALRSVDGRLKIEEATASVGPARLKISLETRAELPGTPGIAAPAEANPSPLARIEEHVQRIDVLAGGIQFDDALFAHLGDIGAKLKRMFSPVGAAELGYRFTREPGGGWKREFEVRPQAAGMSYEKFRFPVGDIYGSVVRTITHTGPETTTVDLRGKASGQQVTVRGQITGPGPDPGINLRIAGTSVPISDQLIAALPGRYPDLIRQFRATGRANFIADIHQEHGRNLSENQFRVEIQDATVKYDLFPYQLDKVKGKISVHVSVSEPRPGGPPQIDRDELVLTDFTGVHDGATIWLNGAKRPIPGTKDRRLVLQVGGNGCKIDDDLRAALAGLMKSDTMWTSFAPRGTLTFTADVEALDRGPPPGRPNEEPPFRPESDLELTFNFSGPTVTPSFFAYELTDLSGRLVYKNERVELNQLASRHGESRLKLGSGDIRFGSNGVVWADLRGLDVTPVIPEPALLKALPGKLRSAIEDLKVKGGINLTFKQLVVQTPPTAATPPLQVVPITAPTSLAPAPGPVVARGQLPGPVTPAPGPPGRLPTLPPVPAPPTIPDPVVYWDLEARLAGASMDTGVAWEELFGAIVSQGLYEGTHLGLVVGNIGLDRGVIARLPLTGVQGKIRAEPQAPDPAKPGQYLPTTMEFKSLLGNLFHGFAGGSARIVLTDPVQYVVFLEATDVQLGAVAQHYNLGSDADLKGIAQGQIRLSNRLDPRTGTWVVEGLGKADVPTGRMYNLPILLDLMKVFKGSAPDKTAFEEGHAVFRINGDRIKVEQLDLIGKAVCVGGSGEVSTDGQYVRFEFYTLGSQILAKLVNTPVGDLSAYLSKNLFKIRLTRENGELRYKPEPVPVITEPARSIMDRLRRQMGK